MKTKARRTILCTFIAVVLALGCFPSAAMCEHTAWDCPDCGRKGNTGNYCGGCGSPAPWINLKEQNDELTRQINALKNQLQQEKDSASAQLAELQTALAELQVQIDTLTAEKEAALEALNTASTEKDAMNAKLAELQATLTEQKKTNRRADRRKGSGAGSVEWCIHRK